MRKDAFGFFWDTPAAVKGKRDAAPRVIPAIPDNGWKPRDFPRLENAKLIGLDTETKDPDLEEKGPGVRRGAHIVGLSVATEDGYSWYWPMRHEIGENVPVENVMRWANDELTREHQPKVGTNLIYDLDFLEQEGVKVEGPYYDIQVEEALLDENAFGYALEDMAQRHLGRGKVASELEEWALAAYGEKKWKNNIYRCPPCLVGPYAESDALLPIEVHKIQQRHLANQNLLPLWETEMAQLPLLLAMRRRGVRVNLKRAKQIENMLEEKLIEDQAKIDHIAGFQFNPNTKEHLVRLFDSLGLAYPRTSPSKRHPTGQPSFVKEFLEHHQHPVAQMIVDRRKWEKFRDTFIRSYIYDMQIGGRVHCQFNQTKNDEYGTIARYSSSMPNLQNIPKRDKYWGPLIRSIFVPEPGEVWGKLDYSQIEYRLLVARAKQPSALAAQERYRTDPTTDFHKYVSSITNVERDHAKNINFGLVYGLGEQALADQLGIPLEEARVIFNIYHTEMPFVQEERKRAQALAASQGYITTIMERRRRFELWEPMYYDSNAPKAQGRPLGAAIAEWGHRLRRAYTHKALNGEIQGSAADLIKKAMQDLWDSNVIDVLGVPLLTVHDELDWSIPRTREGREAFKHAKHVMEVCYDIGIPIVAEMATGPNWGAAK